MVKIKQKFAKKSILFILVMGLLYISYSIIVNIAKLQKNINELEAIIPRDVSVKMEIVEKKHKLQKVLSKQFDASPVDWIEKIKPFQNNIGPYTVKDLSVLGGKSGTAFLLETQDGKKYKLRIGLNSDENANITNIVEKNKISLPEYYGHENHYGYGFFLSKRLEEAHDLRGEDTAVYDEPEELYKKPAKEMARINMGSEIHKNGIFQKKLVSTWMERTKDVFSSDEFLSIQSFFDKHFKSDSLQYGTEHWDSHAANFMIEKSNPDKAYSIDDGAIADNYLIGFGFGSFMVKNLSELEVRKFLKGYFKIYPTMEFGRSYFELIYGLQVLKNIFKGVRDSNPGKIAEYKQKLLVLIDFSKNEDYKEYKDKIPVLYHFIHEEKLAKGRIN